MQTSPFRQKGFVSGVRIALELQLTPPVDPFITQRRHFHVEEHLRQETAPSVLEAQTRSV